MLRVAFACISGVCLFYGVSLAVILLCGSGAPASNTHVVSDAVTFGGVFSISYEKLLALAFVGLGLLIGVPTLLAHRAVVHRRAASDARPIPALPIARVVRR